MKNNTDVIVKLSYILATSSVGVSIVVFPQMEKSHLLTDKNGEA